MSAPPLPTLSGEPLKRSYRKYFLRAIKRNYPDSHATIVGAVENNYRKIAIDTAFSVRSSNPLDRRLDFCACFLALIKTLDEQDEDFDMVRKVSLEVVTDYVMPKNRLQRVMKRVPAMLIGTPIWNSLIGILARKLSGNDNRDGFIAKVITSKDETYGLGYGVDIIECGVCKLFNKHNFGKYTSILCEVDKMTSGFAGLELIRRGTIANGASKCDFRYRKVMP